MGGWPGAAPALGAPLFPRQEVTSGLQPSQHTVNERRGSECAHAYVCVCVCVSVCVRERERERLRERGTGEQSGRFLFVIEAFFELAGWLPPGKVTSGDL